MIYKTLGDLAPALVDTTDLSRTNALEFWESNINISFSFFHLWSLLHIVPSAWKALSTNPLATPFTWLTFLWSSTQRDLPPLPSSVCVSCSVMSNPLRPMDWSRPGSSVHGILQARILEWVAISFSRGSSQPRDWAHVSCVSCIVRGFFTHWAMKGMAVPLLFPLNLGLDDPLYLPLSGLLQS